MAAEEGEGHSGMSSEGKERPRRKPQCTRVEVVRTSRDDSPLLPPSSWS